MNVFDIVGPIMVGPSSSHTAGAVKIGRIARELLGEEPRDVTVKFHGSFASTYKGHGTDRAIIAGLMAMTPDDLQVRNSLELVEKAGFNFKFETAEIKNSHPNTVLIEVTGISGKEVKIIGSSIGGGNIVIKHINGLDVEFTGQYNTLIILHKDTPGMIAAVTHLLGHSGINIAQMKVFRAHRGGNAIMVIETDQQVSEEIKTMIGYLPSIINVRKIVPV